ncbi:extracellular solute-binding protein [uncultured Tateyamaria sp.]|uniref:extracellular solute-binding protein n=1 Tax=uncultured Tateyamaria sp. TaxID=455651 RepID=UPI00262EBF30|nr:extracellular solute-binding protein [uncultured Tateyamaria sp.]
MTKVFSLAAALLGTVSMAQAEALTIYSPQGEDNVAWIEAQAEAAGHDVDFLRAGGGELFSRLEAEKNNPQADVVLGLNDIAMARLKAQGMFQAHVPTWADGLPASYSDADGVVHKFWQTPIVIAYNPDRIAADAAPSGWLDLTKDAYAQNYVLGPTKWGTTQVILAGILVQFADENGTVSDDGWDFMADLYGNSVLVSSGDEKIAALSSGEAAIDLNWFGGAFREAGKSGYDPVLVNPENGTPIVAEGIAVMAGTDQADAAKAFVDWFGSVEVMAAYATEFGQMPSHPDAIAAAPAEVQAKAQLVSAQAIDWDLVAANLDGWLQKIELEIK